MELGDAELKDCIPSLSKNIITVCNLYTWSFGNIIYEKFWENYAKFGETVSWQWELYGGKIQYVRLEEDNEIIKV